MINCPSISEAKIYSINLMWYQFSFGKIAKVA